MARPVDAAFLVNNDKMAPQCQAGSIVIAKKQPVQMKNDDKAIIYDEGNEKLMLREVHFLEKDREIQIGLRKYNPNATAWHFYSDKDDGTVTSNFKIVAKVMDFIDDDARLQKLLEEMERIERD